MLKKRFGRGSYGEVWLAFYWNCHQDHNASIWSKRNGHSSFDASLNSTKRNSSCGSANDCSSGSPDGDLFVLKRIMVIGLLFDPILLLFCLNKASALNVVDIYVFITLLSSVLHVKLICTHLSYFVACAVYIKIKH